MPEDSSTTVSRSAILRTMKSILELCAIEHLEGIAASYALEGWGHRCRVAYDGIKAFVLRNDPTKKEQVAIAGRAYVRGALSLLDVATLLNLHSVDAVVLLEELGFAKAIEQISLSDEDRERIYATMRRDRIQREARPNATPTAVARDVVASERIEGVDARRWIPREGR